MKIVNLKSNTPEWLEWRKSGIGSSDIAAIMGVSPWSSAKDIYFEKKGLQDGKMQNAAMAKGHKYEDAARRKFNALRMLQFNSICIEREDYSFMKASLDGYCAEENTILEIKVPGKKDLALAEKGEVPEYYNLQMQWQLMVSGAKHGYFVCYRPETDEIHIVTVYPDADLQNKLKEESFHFWDNFLKSIPPEGQKGDCDYIFDPELEEVVAKYIEVKRSLEVEEEILEQYRKQILSFGGGSNFRAYGITVAKSKPRTVYDVEAMRSSGIDVERFAKPLKTSDNYRITINK